MSARPLARYPKTRGFVIRTERVREIRVTALADGTKHALWRWTDARDPYWTSMPASRAEAALRVGRMAHAGFESAVVAHVEPKERAA